MITLHLNFPNNWFLLMTLVFSHSPKTILIKTRLLIIISNKRKRLIKQKWKQFLLNGIFCKTSDIKRKKQQERNVLFAIFQIVKSSSKITSDYFSPTHCWHTSHFSKWLCSLAVKRFSSQPINKWKLTVGTVFTCKENETSKQVHLDQLSIQSLEKCISLSGYFIMPLVWHKDRSKWV